MKIKVEKKFIFQLLGLLIPLGIWGVLSYIISNPIFLPSILDVVGSFFELVEKGFFLDVGSSILRVIFGLIVAGIFAFPVGIALGVNKNFRSFGMNSISFIRYIPPSAFIPLLILWMGIGESQKIFFIFLAIAPYIALLVADAVMRIPQEYSDHADVYGASVFQKIKTVTIPAVLPDFLDIIRAMYGAAWTFIILAEIVGATRGVGHVMVQAQRFLQTDTIFVGIIVTGIIGVISDLLLAKLNKKLFKWRK